MAETGAAAGALDETGHVGDRRPALVLVAEVHDAEVRLERRERVVGDLGPRRGERREQRRLAGVRQPDEADVGDEPELQPQPVLLARLALLGVARRLVGRGREMRVAEAAAPAAGDHRGLAGHDEVGEQAARLVVECRRARRDVEVQVVAGRAVAPGPLAAAAGRRPEVVLVAEVAERRLAGVDAEVDRPATAAVAAVGAAARDVRLAPERRRSVTARAGRHPDLDAVEEHRADSTDQPAADARAETGGPASGVRLEVDQRVDAGAAVPDRARATPRSGGADPSRCPSSPTRPTCWPRADALAAPDRDRRHVVVRRVQVRAVGDPDLVAAAVALPAGEDHRPAGRGLDARAAVGLDVDRVVAVVVVLADGPAGDRPGERPARVPGRRPRRPAARPPPPPRRLRRGFGAGFGVGIAGALARPGSSASGR